MEINAVLLILAVIILVSLYVYEPFTARARKIRKGESHEVSSLKAERDRVINSLQELDFDHRLGKIPAEDYPEQRATLLQKGADILRKLDDLAPAITSGGKAESRIEKAAAAARADSSEKLESLSDEEIESMLAVRRKQAKSKSAGFCPKCGKPVLATDKFCPSCGKALK